MPKKSWVEKRDGDKKPVVKELTINFGGMKSGDKMLVSSPAEIDKFVRKIKKGKSVSVEKMRTQLAKKHKADGTCPASTGIYLRIIAEAAFEEIEGGADEAEVTPFWRMIEPGSKIAGKLACGSEFIQALREAEGLDD